MQPDPGQHLEPANPYPKWHGLHTAWEQGAEHARAEDVAWLRECEQEAAAKQQATEASVLHNAADGIEQGWAFILDSARERTRPLPFAGSTGYCFSHGIRTDGAIDALTGLPAGCDASCRFEPVRA